MPIDFELQQGLSCASLIAKPNIDGSALLA